MFVLVNGDIVFNPFKIYPVSGGLQDLLVILVLWGVGGFDERKN